MTASTISQPLSNAVAQTQQGYGVVAQAKVDFSGGDALVGFSASAWTQTQGQISLQLWLDGQPVGGQLSIYANATAMHLSLGRTWVWCEAVSPGAHELTVIAGPNTITDLNDRVSLTVWELGDGMAVRTVTDSPCPAGTAVVPLVRDTFALDGGQLLLSSSVSGWVSQAGQMIAAPMLIDRGDALTSQVFANNANQHMATVPVDLVYMAGLRGQHDAQLNGYSTTSTDSGDYAHLAVLEWINPPDAPVVLEMNPRLQDAVANTQQGSGGIIAQSTFQSNGGTLLVRTNVSAFSTTPNVSLEVGIQIDGTSRGFTEVFANPAETHMALVSNDLVVPGVPAGSHSFDLLGEANPFTDQNDRVSVLIMEFPKGSTDGYAS